MYLCGNFQIRVKKIYNIAFQCSPEPVCCPDPSNGITSLACCHFPQAEAGDICFSGEGVLNSYCALPCLNKIQHADAFSVTPIREESASLSPAERPQHPSACGVARKRMAPKLWTISILQRIFLDHDSQQVTWCCTEKLGYWRIWQPGICACGCHRNGSEIIMICL